MTLFKRPKNVYRFRFCPSHAPSFGALKRAKRSQLPTTRRHQIRSEMATNGEVNGIAVNEPHKSFDTILVLDFGYDSSRLGENHN